VRCKICFVDDQKVTFGDARPAFSGNFFASSHINHIDGEVTQFGRKGGSQVIPSAFDKNDVSIGIEL